MRIATAQREQRVQILKNQKYVIQTMPTKTKIEHRNRALIAFTLLRGANQPTLELPAIRGRGLRRRCCNRDMANKSWVYPVGLGLGG